MSAGRLHEWLNDEGPVGQQILELNGRCLAAYAANPALIEEHARLEIVQTEGGYGRRQVWELIQNGADEMLREKGRVSVVLTGEHLYCANQGEAVTPEGVGAILSAYRSSKHGPEIGRFGLGFKSVLGVSSTPEFFSTSGSFRFDPAFARTQITAVLPDVGQVPTLRLAMPMDAGAAAESDEILAELMEWAVTVVRLPLEPDAGDWLHADLADFPAEFLVFTPHISTLELRDAALGMRREIRLAAGARPFEHRLLEGDGEDVWRVFGADFRPSERAARDGGAMADRELVRLQWAVPVRARHRIGGLWAYFPTLEETTLSGVLNAPWKLNDDRTRVIPGPFNQEILDNATALVLDNLEVLTTPDDPGNILDILPARGREDRNWADGYLTDRLNSAASTFPSIPDQTGALALPATLTLPPADVSRDALELWSRVETRPVNWAHMSVNANQTRRSRAERFVNDSPGGYAADIDEWLEALIPPPQDSPDLMASARAILVAARVVKDDPALLPDVRTAEIVVDSDGALAYLGDVLLPGERPVAASGIHLVHPRLAANQNLRAALRQLDVHPVDAELELRTVLGQWKYRPTAEIDWELLWELAERTSPQQALAALTDAGLGSEKVRVRVASGQFVALARTLLPGDIARRDTAPSVVIDVDYHRPTLPLLRLLGAVSAAVPGGAREDEPAMKRIYHAAVEAFVKHSRGNPNRKNIKLEAGTVAGPLSPLEALEGAAKAHYTRALLEAQAAFPSCDVTYPTNRYPPFAVEHPIVTIVREHGLAQTELGLVGPKSWVGPGLRNWSKLLPVANIPAAAAEALQIPLGLEDLDDARWAEAYRRAVELADLDLAGRFYVVANRVGAPRPEEMLASVGAETDAVPVDEIRVTASPRTAAVLRSGRCPVLEVDSEDVAGLLEGWRLRRGDDEIASEVRAIESSARTPLVDVFPALRHMLAEDRQDLLLASCSEIRIETAGAGGRQSETTRFHLDADVVYALDSIGPTELLRLLSGQLALGLDPPRIDAILENKLTNEIRARIRDVRAKPTPEEKLAVVVPREKLEAALPAPLLRAAAEGNGSLTHEDLARLALAVYGVETLHTFVEDFREQGLQPPSSWAGSTKAISWVTDLGFGREHAGFPGARREPVLEVDGPPALKALHEYQRAVADEIREIVRRAGTAARPRGMVGLPTGSGKTRVTIEALIEAVKADELGSPILWVAQRDELCEQAVQAWSEVWRDRGPNDRLTISRLWSGNEAEAVPHGTQVVVATIAKLNTDRVMRGRAYDWLKMNASCIVVDEAHFGITPAYTGLLEWQGMDRGKERAPLIGLTATPFRGTSDEETRQLVRRFGERLDRAAFGDGDPYRELQDIGVLSRVEHRVLAGSDIRLTEDELVETRRTRLLPASASDRLGADVKRNRELLESILALPSDFTVLVFCVSLDQASVMAGLLSSAGVPTASVSGDTPPAVRRYYVEEFRARRLRVLTNYAVFQEGFDAPKVRAVFVARPTYSPNVYLQMIGRGLRGPLNGGTEECLIVNVADNVVNFGEELAFREFEHLWSGDE
jgi:superfamily II DNA or RNA helicase